MRYPGDQTLHSGEASCKFLALTTKIQELESKLSANATNSGNGNGTENKQPFKIDEWRYVKHGKSVKKDGKMWWWHPKHNNGNGMYVRHPPCDHDQWAAQKTTGQKYTPPDYRPGYKPDSEDKNQPASNSNSKESQKLKLAIDERLRSVLCSRLMLSEQDAKNVSKEIIGE